MRNQDCRLLLWFMLAAILGVAFMVCLVLLVLLHPEAPGFYLRDVTIYDFNISQPNLLSSKLQVTLSSTNIDDEAKFSYDRLNIYASYRNQEVTLAKSLPSTYKKPMEVAMWSPVLTGSAVSLTPFSSSALHEDLSAGMVLLNIKIDGRVRWKVGPLITGVYRLHVTCPVYIQVSGQSADAGPVKPQFLQRCVR